MNTKALTSLTSRYEDLLKGPTRGIHTNQSLVGLYVCTVLEHRTTFKAVRNHTIFKRYGSCYRYVVMCNTALLGKRYFCRLDNTQTFLAEFIPWDH